MKMYKVLDTKNNREWEVTENLIGKKIKGYDNGKEICLKAGVLGGIYFNYEDLEEVTTNDIKITHVTIDLTEEQKELLQNVANEEYINAIGEHKESIKEFGIDFQDLVEWMTDAKRIKIFGTSSFNIIFNLKEIILNNLMEEYEVKKNIHIETV